MVLVVVADKDDCAQFFDDGAVVLFFEAPAISLSKFSFLMDRNLNTAQQKMPKWSQSFYENDPLIHDSNGYHCGVVQGLLPNWTGLHDPKCCEFVLLSLCQQGIVTPEKVKVSYNLRTENFHTTHNYYDEVFDTNYYVPKEEWALNVMLVEWRGKVTVRVAVGQMHVDAWSGAGGGRKELIALA